MKKRALIMFLAASMCLSAMPAYATEVPTTMMVNEEAEQPAAEVDSESADSIISETDLAGDTEDITEEEVTDTPDDEEAVATESQDEADPTENVAEEEEVTLEDETEITQDAVMATSESKELTITNVTADLPKQIYNIGHMPEYDVTLHVQYSDGSISTMKNLHAVDTQSKFRDEATGKDIFLKLDAVSYHTCYPNYFNVICSVDQNDFTLGQVQPLNQDSFSVKRLSGPGTHQVSVSDLTAGKYLVFPSNGGYYRITVKGNKNNDIVFIRDCLKGWGKSEKTVNGAVAEDLFDTSGYIYLEFVELGSNTNLTVTIEQTPFIESYQLVSNNYFVMDEVNSFSFVLNYEDGTSEKFDVSLDLKESSPSGVATTKYGYTIGYNLFGRDLKNPVKPCSISISTPIIQSLATVPVVPVKDYKNAVSCSYPLTQSGGIKVPATKAGQSAIGKFTSKITGEYEVTGISGNLKYCIYEENNGTLSSALSESQVSVEAGKTYYIFCVNTGKNDLPEGVASVDYVGKPYPCMIYSCWPSLEAAGIKTPVTFTVNATNAVSYQWQYSKDGVKWYNSTTSTAKTSKLKLTLSKTNYMNMYRCKVTGKDGNTLYTESMGIDLIPWVTIKEQPVTSATTTGNTVSFHVKAENALAYQWQYKKNGSTWVNSTAPGSDTDTLSLKVSNTNKSNMYRCVIMGIDGNKEASKEAAILVLQEQPKDSYAKIGTKATFSLKADGAVSYQWQYSKDGVKWYNSSASGNTTDTMSLNVTSGNRNHMYRCKIETESGAYAYTKAVGFK